MNNTISFSADKGANYQGHDNYGFRVTVSPRSNSRLKGTVENLNDENILTEDPRENDTERDNTLDTQSLESSNGHIVNSKTDETLKGHPTDIDSWLEDATKYK